MFLGFAFGALLRKLTLPRLKSRQKCRSFPIRHLPKSIKLRNIKVTGIKNYDDFVLIGFSGLSVGDEVTIPEPGGAITDAVKRFWKHGLFSDVRFWQLK